MKNWAIIPKNKMQFNLYNPFFLNNEEELCINTKNYVITYRKINNNTNLKNTKN